MTKPNEPAIWQAKEWGYSQKEASESFRKAGHKFPDKWFRKQWHNQDILRPPVGGRGAPRTGVLPGLDIPPGPVTNGADEPLSDEAAPLYGGTLHAPDVARKPLAGKRFVFTCAQNNTSVNTAFLSTLIEFCKLNTAQLIVSRFSYNKNGWANHNGADGTKKDTDLWYDPAIAPYVLDQQVEVAPGLIFCGELDILPTNRYPLAGLDNYTGPNSSIIPHVKMQMRSLATIKEDDPKFLYSTGTITLRNYINRRAGQVASFNHVYGALFVEVDELGRWFTRQLNADDNGDFYDLDICYHSDGSCDAASGPIINLGDIHAEKTDEVQFQGALDLIKTIEPSHIFVHDLLDFEARNHHNKKDPLFLAEMFYRNTSSVWANLQKAASMLQRINYPNTTTFVIRSNHDEAFKRWLREVPTAPDPENDLFWHQGNAKIREKMKEGDYKFDIFHWAIRKAALSIGYDLSNVVFVQEDESLVIRSIEFGMHGHLGPNGAKGSPAGFRQIGRRANTGHTHSAGIIDGVWTAGVLGSLDMGYNKGPSSWSCSHIITYRNGKRAIVTQRGKEWHGRGQ